MASLDELRKQDMLKRAGVQAPMPGMFERAFPNTFGAVRDRQSEITQARQTGGLGAAAGQSMRTAGTPLIGLLEDTAQGIKRTLDPAAQALKTFATGDATPIGQSPLVSAATPKPAAPAAYSNEGRNVPPSMQTESQKAMPAMSETVASNPLARQIAPGVFRQGNSYGDSAESAAAFANNKPVSAQNMAAADQIAARYSNPLVKAAEQPPVNQNLTPADTGQGTGYGLLNSNRIAQRNAMMDVQQLKPGSGRALSALLQQQADAPKLNLERDQMNQRGQESAADRLMRRDELTARVGESAADRLLKSQELADNSLTNAAKREALGIETGAAKQMADLRTAYMNAKTPEEQTAVAAKINALSGKGQAQDEYMAVSSGQTVDPATGLAVKGPDLVVNKRTGQPVTGAQAAKPAQVPGAPAAGTVKGGYRFKGGDPAQPSSWEKV